MRKVWLLLLLAPSALVYACSGDSNTNDGGTDATANDAAPDVAKQDTGTKDTGTQDTGVQDSGTQDVNVTITCMRPANCIDGGDQDAAYAPDSGEVCCGTVQTSGTFPSCSFDQAGTACAAPGTCPTTIGFSSCGTDQVRLCSADTECTETTYNKCCSTAFGDAGARVHFCGNQTLVTATGGKISCP